MPNARKNQVCLEATPYYHCISRCVRRAFLCGQDTLTKRSFDHRKQWVVDYLKLQAKVFCIEICAYAVMSNHYHTVLFVNQEKALQLEPYEVLIRWQKLFSLPDLAKKYLNDEPLSLSESDELELYIALIRSRLTDISWFMRYLNEKIARRANLEDQCTGRFWEGRFKSQALLDEAALLTCMVYVDLNPVRAGITDTPENSEFTSIQDRIRYYKNQEKQNIDHLIELKKSNDMEHINSGQKLHHNTKDNIQSENSNSLNTFNQFTMEDYFELVDWSGRIVRDEKIGSIDQHIPPILYRLNINPVGWKQFMNPDKNRFLVAIGTANKMQDFAQQIKQHWIHGINYCRLLFSTA